MSAHIVCCQGVSKYFLKTAAVQNLDLEVSQGEILALLGPSGCGKTTTLRLIAGFERPDAGRIVLDGREVASASVSVPPEQRRIGMVFQNYALFPHLSVGQNIAYGLDGKTPRAARVREVLEMVDLAGLEGRMPHELSGGQQQRVALARALAPKPSVLLLDEPFSGLDASLREQVRGDVARILRASGATVIFVTHNQEEALLMGDRIAVMHGGRIEQLGTPEQIFGAPQTRFVAEFMGETDFLTGWVRADGVETEIGRLHQRLELPIGTRVELVVRPDDVELVVTPQANATVIERRYRGTMHVYRLELDSGATLHTFADHTLRLEPGARVQASARQTHPLPFLAPD